MSQTVGKRVLALLSIETPTCDFGLEVGGTEVEFHWLYFLEYGAVSGAAICCSFRSSLVKNFFFFNVKCVTVNLVSQIVVSI